MDIAIVFIGTSLAGFITLLYHLVSVRLLSSEDYGTLNALISLIAFTSMAIFPFTATLTRFFTEYLTKKDFDSVTYIFFKFLKKLIVFALALFLLFVIFAQVLGSFLNIPSIYIIVCGTIITFTLISPPFFSLIQSSQKFGLFSFIIVSSSLTKLAIGFFLMLLGLNVLGGLFGYLGGSVLSLSLFLISITYFLKNHKRNREKQDHISKVDLLPIYKYFFPVSLSMVSFAILTNIDLILVKHFFSPLDAGYYSLAQMVGKILLFLPFAVSIAIFPKSIQSYVHHSNAKALLYKSLIFLGFLCGGISFFCFLFPDLVLKILTSQYNPVSRKLVGLFSLAMSFYALLWIITNFLLATHHLKFVLPLMIFSFLEAIFIYLYPTSLIAVLWIVLIFSILTFITILPFAIRFKN